MQLLSNQKGERKKKSIHAHIQASQPSHNEILKEVLLTVSQRILGGIRNTFFFFYQMPALHVSSIEIETFEGRPRLFKRYVVK